MVRKNDQDIHMQTSVLVESVSKTDAKNATLKHYISQLDVESEKIYKVLNFAKRYQKENVIDRIRWETL